MTLDIGTQLLVIALLDELTDALAQRDGENAISVLDHIGTVAGREFADRLTRELILAGLTRMATRHSDGNPPDRTGGRR
jgi:hypothetical protein